MDRGDGEACFAVIPVLEYARRMGCLPLIIDTPFCLAQPIERYHIY